MLYNKLYTVYTFAIYVYTWILQLLFSFRYITMQYNHLWYCSYFLQFQEKFAEAKTSAKELLEQRRRQKNKESDQLTATVAAVPASSVHSDSNAHPPGSLMDGGSSAPELERGENAHDFIYILYNMNS